VYHAATISGPQCVERPPLDLFSPCYSTEGRIQGELASGGDFGGSPSPAAASSAPEGMGNLEFVARSVY